jgi:hypothetical protein
MGEPKEQAWQASKTESAPSRLVPPLHEENLCFFWGGFADSEYNIRCNIYVSATGSDKIPLRTAMSLRNGHTRGPRGRTNPPKSGRPPRGINPS